MDHSFNTSIAKEYGVEGSVIIHNIYFWVEKNKANSRHFYDGKHWTYNSVQAYTLLFPYWTRRQIERILKNLETNGAIVTGNFHSNQYNRTKWYSLTERVYCIYANGEMETHKRGNEYNTDNKPDEKHIYGDKPQTPKKKKAFKPPTVEEVAAYCRERSNGIDAETFVAHYEATDWKRGKSEIKIKNWKACVVTWEKRNNNQPSPKQQTIDQILSGQRSLN